MFKKSIIVALFLFATFSICFAGGNTLKQIDNIQNSMGGASLAVPSVGVNFCSDTNTLSLQNKTISSTNNTISATLSGNLTDVSISSPASGDILGFNGSVWVNQIPSFGNAGSGIEFFLDDTATIDGYGGLLTAPNTAISTVTDTISVTAATSPVFSQGYMSSNALGGTQIDGGEWEFDFYADVNSVAAGSVSSLGIDVFDVQVNPPACSVITSGSGTTRSALITGCATFVPSDANANPRLASYLQTSTGTFQISAYTSSTSATIITPAGYSNQFDVDYSKHLHLFSASIPAVGGLTTTAQQLYSSILVEPPFTLAAATDKIAIRTYGVSNATRTVRYYHNGMTAYSHFHIPQGPLTFSTPLLKTGDNISLLYDNSTIGLNGSNQIYVKNSSIGTAQMTSGAAANGTVATANGSGAVNYLAIPGTSWLSYSPSISASSGTLTSASATGRYAQLGKTTFFDAIGTITTNGSGTSSIVISLPATANTSIVVAGRENAMTGKMLQGVISGGTSNVVIFDYSNQYPGASGASITIGGMYEAQ